MIPSMSTEINTFIAGFVEQVQDGSPGELAQDPHEAQEADGRRQQMRTNDVAGDEMLLTVRDLVETVGVDQATAVIQNFKSGQVTALANGRDEARRMLKTRSVIR